MMRGGNDRRRLSMGGRLRHGNAVLTLLLVVTASPACATVLDYITVEIVPISVNDAYDVLAVFRYELNTHGTTGGASFNYGWLRLSQSGYATVIENRRVELANADFDTTNRFVRQLLGSPALSSLPPLVHNFARENGFVQDNTWQFARNRVWRTGNFDSRFDTDVYQRTLLQSTTSEWHALVHILYEIGDLYLLANYVPGWSDNVMDGPQIGATFDFVNTAGPRGARFTGYYIVGWIRLPGRNK